MRSLLRPERAVPRGWRPIARAWPLLIALALAAGDVALRSTVGPAEEAAFAPESDPPIDPVETVPPGALSAFCGAGSCAASNCHGGVARTGSDIRGDEFMIWKLRDPHAKAYQVLLTGKGLEIVNNLSPRPAGMKPDERIPFDKAPEAVQRRCLACHATGGLEGVGTGLANDGVSCESCHGPAEGWLAAHTQYDWTGTSPARKAELGFIDTNNLVDRARQCVECHVGTIDGDVNHDLYAAGHPQMHFELFAYDAQLPRHWSVEKQEREYGPDYAHDLLVVGALASAEAASELLARRIDMELNPANDKQGQHVWPELTEYSCFSCHQDLGPKKSGYAGTGERAAKPFGVTTWGTWPYALVDRFAGAENSAAWQAVFSQAVRPNELKRSLDAVRAPMGRIYLNPKQLEQLHADVETLHGQLAACLNGMRAAPPRQPLPATVLDDRAQDVAGWLGEAAGLSWDGATQLYLALESLRASGAKVAPSRAELRDKLTFPDEPDRFDSPFDKDPPRGLNDVLRP